MIVLIDSDILIEVFRARNSDIMSKWTNLSNSNATILYSSITAAEVWGGARTAEFERLTDLFGTLSCISIDEESGRRAGSYMRQYRKNHAVDIADALIAAGAVASKAALWTRNRKHYPMKDLAFFD